MDRGSVVDLQRKTKVTAEREHNPASVKSIEMNQHLAQIYLLPLPNTEKVSI